MKDKVARRLIGELANDLGFEVNDYFGTLSREKWNECFVSAFERLKALEDFLDIEWHESRTKGYRKRGKK